VRVIIIGAGQVGSSIAADLADSHDVVVVDRDPDLVDELHYSLDVLSIRGDGTTIDTMEEAGVADADMVIATTDNDETNLVVCATAKALGDAFTIARVKQVEYLRTWERSTAAFGVDFMVCTNLLAAQTIVRIISLPAARDVDPFSDGLVQMAEFDVSEDSPVVDETVAEADRYNSLTFAAVVRNGDVELPTGDTVIRANDRVVVIGSPESVRQFAGDVAPEHAVEAAREVVVVGGSEVGYHLARLLARQGVNTRLLERDPERARELAEELPDTVVMETDATDTDFLEREHVGDADVLVTALDADEKNLLVALLGERLGVERTISVVDDAEYVDLFEAVGVDVSLNPRQVVAEEITRFTREGGAENVSLVAGGAAEVLEVEIDADSVLADRPIRESVADLPEGVVLGAITRGREFVVPRGDTVVQRGDHVVAFASADCADAVDRLL
jgi:trk system potassium uptake protein TrkA